ncbi:hypothetical protein TNCV_2511771 [Trichonephila clavipes]|nr:hypothetical protein TNCV_2511771 [Trichonephila clavipes]
MATGSYLTPIYSRSQRVTEGVSPGIAFASRLEVFSGRRKRVKSPENSRANPFKGRPHHSEKHPLQNSGEKVLCLERRDITASIQSWLAPEEGCIMVLVEPQGSARETYRGLGLPPSSIRNIHHGVLNQYSHKLQFCPELLPSDTVEKSICEEYCEDDALFILPAGLGPVKSRQDDLKYCKNTRGNQWNELQQFFRTSDCIENDTTMEDDSFRQESPVNTSRETFFFLNLILISLVVWRVFLNVLINNVWNMKKTNNGKKAKFEWDDDEEFFSSPEKFTPFSSPNQIKRWGA